MCCFDDQTFDNAFSFQLRKAHKAFHKIFLLAWYFTEDFPKWYNKPFELEPSWVKDRLDKGIMPDPAEIAGTSLDCFYIVAIAHVESNDSFQPMGSKFSYNQPDAKELCREITKIAEQLLFERIDIEFNSI